MFLDSRQMQYKVLILFQIPFNSQNLVILDGSPFPNC